MWSIAIFAITLVSLVNADTYGGLYFDQQNLTYAQCVPNNKLYTYFGTKNTDVNGVECAKWSDVREDLAKQMKDYYQYYFPTEYGEHNYCRTVLLDQYERDSDVNPASAHSFVDTDGWRHGPWCYVLLSPNEPRTQLWYGKFQSSYKPSPCFNHCADKKDAPTTSKATQQPRIEKPAYHQYNEDLIENLSDRFYNNYNHGDARYYTDKLNKQDKLSLGFEIRRHYVFFIFVGILAATAIIAIGTRIWNYYRRKKQVEGSKKAPVEPI